MDRTRRQRLWDGHRRHGLRHGRGQQRAWRQQHIWRHRVGRHLIGHRQDRRRVHWDRAQWGLWQQTSCIGSIPRQHKTWSVHHGAWPWARPWAWSRPHWRVEELWWSLRHRRKHRTLLPRSHARHWHLLHLNIVYPWHGCSLIRPHTLGSLHGIHRQVSRHSCEWGSNAGRHEASRRCLCLWHHPHRPHILLHSMHVAWASWRNRLLDALTLVVVEVTEPAFISI